MVQLRVDLRDLGSEQDIKQDQYVQRITIMSDPAAP